MRAIVGSKALVPRYFDEFENAAVDGVDGVIGRFGGDDLRFRGVHLFNEIQGASEIADTIWRPLREAFPRMQIDSRSPPGNAA